MNTKTAFLAIRYKQGDEDTLRRVAILELAERWHVPPWDIEAHPEWLDDAIAYDQAMQKHLKFAQRADRLHGH